MNAPLDPMAWLRETRKLDPALLGYLKVRAVQHPQLGPVVAFPYLRGGESYAAKFRTVDKQFRSTQDVSRGLYNIDEIRSRETLPIVITEGEIDCISVMQAGFDRAVSLPNGWKVQGGETTELVEAEDLLRKSPFVIVAGDNDAAGESLPRVIANLLRGHDVRVARWPDGCKDPNDVLVMHGEGMLAKCLNEATRIDPPGGQITGFSDLPPLSERRVLRITEQPFARVVALEVGALSVWTGIPGSGKSTFLTWAAHHIAVEEGIRVGMFAFETHPHALRDQLYRTRLNRPFAETGEAERCETDAFLDRHFRLVHRVMEEGTTHHMDWLQSMIETLAVRDRCKLIIIDPWNELEHMPAQGETMTAYINWATQRMRQLAEMFDVHIALVAHPKKISEPNRAPTGYDVADSAAFFNKPSLGVTVHQREDEDGESYVDLVVWKVRNTQLYGFTKGRASVAFHPQSQRYSRR